jgi:hypothetical protein
MIDDRQHWQLAASAKATELRAAWEDRDMDATLGSTAKAKP